MPEYKTQIIKLQNGEDLIANVTLNGVNYILEEPMEFAIDERSRESGLIMRHWLPVQLLKKNAIEIQAKDVLSFLEPEEQFCEYYINTVSKIKELLKAKDALDVIEDMDDEELADMISEYEELKHHGITLH
jgi:hypothetical protein